MKKSTKFKLKKIRNAYAFAEYCAGIGMTRANYVRWTLQFESAAGLLVWQINLALHRPPEQNIALTLVITPFIFLGIVLFGYIDIKYLHITQRLNELTALYNPTISGIEKKVKSIYRKIRFF